MQSYEDDLDEQAGYDDYSDNADEYEDYEEEEEEEEEEEQPPKEELEYLELRQKLKDSIRKNNNLVKGSATNAQSSQERRRKLPYNDFGNFFGPSRPVISSRVIQESKSLLENEIQTKQNAKRPVSTSGLGSSVPTQVKRPKVVNELKRKVQTLKDTRDYSFLLSDDAELPIPKKEPLSRIQNSARPKPSSGSNGRDPHEGKRPVSANGHSRPASSSGSQMNQPRPAASRPVAAPGTKRLVPSMNRQAPMRPSQRKQMSSSNGVGPSLSAPLGRPLPSKPSMERKTSILAGKSSLQRQSTSRPVSSDPRQRVLEQRKVSRDPSTSRMVPKRPLPRDIDFDRRPLKKKKPARMSEDELALSWIRERSRPDRWVGRDDDDSDMEANWEDVEKEERRSARIGREEDAKELAEEERRERMKKKSRKLSH